MENVKPIAAETTEEEIVAVNATEDEFMQHFASYFCEWDNGTVIKLSPIHELHDAIVRYLVLLLTAYLGLRPIGQLREGPFVMRLPNVPARREPDIQVILNTNPHPLTPTYMDGPADICIEVVSPESVDRDRGTKFRQYESGGVPEYWIIALHVESLFYRLNGGGVYIRMCPMPGNYHRPICPACCMCQPASAPSGFRNRRRRPRDGSKR
jgi:Uma2 family endonuclease